MEYKSGEKILVRNRDEETWRRRWFVSKHPFKDKVVTVDCTGVLAEWFKSNKLNYDSKENPFRRRG